MLKEFLVIFFITAFSAAAQNSTHRRLFFAVPQQSFKQPHSAAVSIRYSGKWGQAMCSGVLIGKNQVLSAAHCFGHNPRPSEYKIGYGATKIAKQKTVDVKTIQPCRFLDVAVLTLRSDIEETKNMKFFDKSRWNQNTAMDLIVQKTFICGYGRYEGPDKNFPRSVVTEILRCSTYRFSANFKKVKELHDGDSKWPDPPAGSGGFSHDGRYMMSISRDPTAASAFDPYFSTACDGDSGAPVFYEAGGDIKLLGIHHAGPSQCGNISFGLKYDVAVLMNAIQTDC